LGIHAVCVHILNRHDWTSGFHESLLTESEIIRGAGSQVAANHDYTDVMDLLSAIFRNIFVDHQMQ
jgi:hypothetical protein